MNYDKIAQTALTQIRDKGREITVKTPGGDMVYDPATDTFTPGTDVTETVKAVFTQFSVKDVDGELIKRTDKRVLIAASDLDAEPDTQTKIVDGSTEYSVINTETIKPGDTAILYMVQVRR
jgi:hypothetical protein